MTARRSLLTYLACAALLHSFSCAQQSPSTPADSNDSRKLLELNQAATQAKQWAEEARSSVAAADHSLKWLRPLLAEHQRATQSVESAKLLEVAPWLDKWEMNVTDWVWWFEAGSFWQSKDRVWDLDNRSPWSIETADESQADEDALESAKQSLLSDLKSLHEKLCSDDPQGRRYRPWLKICSESSAPDSVQTTLRCTYAWIAANAHGQVIREAKRNMEHAAGENSMLQLAAEQALAQAKESMPKLKQRAAETSEWAKEAREGDDYDKIRIADEAKRMAAAELTRCEKEKERATATIAECAAAAKEHEAKRKQFAIEITAADADLKTKHAAATKAWTDLVAAVAAKVKSLEEESKKGHDDAALFDQAAARWLQEAKQLARAKGR